MGDLERAAAPGGSHAPMDTSVHIRAHTQARLLMDTHVLRPHTHVSRHRAACLGFGNTGVRGAPDSRPRSPHGKVGVPGAAWGVLGYAFVLLKSGLGEAGPTRWPQGDLFPLPLQEASPSIPDTPAPGAVAWPPFTLL